MGAVLTLAAKDLRLLWRDRMGLFWVLGFPLILAVLFGSMFAGPGPRAVSALPVAVADRDGTELSRALLERLRRSEALAVAERDDQTAREEVRLRRQVAYVVIPNGFELNAGIFGNETVEFEVGVDPARHAETGILQGVLLEEIHELLLERMSDPEKLRAALQGAEMGVRFNQDIASKQKAKLEKFLGDAADVLKDVDAAALKEGLGKPAARIVTVEVTRSPELAANSFEVTFPSGMLWGLIGCVTTFALSLARERRSRTLLRLRLAPVGAAQVLAGKALACLAAALAMLALLTLAGHLVFGVRVLAPAHLALAMVSAAACFAGLMSAIGTLGQTESATAGAGWALMMLLAMFGGAMMPVHFMPDWMQQASNVSPVKWGILALEGALWRGFSWGELLPVCGGLLIVGAAGFGAGALRLSRERNVS